MISKGGNADLWSHPRFYSSVFKWAPAPLTRCLMRVWLLPPALIIHHSSVVPVWIESSASLIQGGSCHYSFLHFESVCSKLGPDLKWRSVEVWQDRRLVLISEAFEQCALPRRRDGGRWAAFCQPELPWALGENELANPDLAWSWKPGLERPEGTDSGTAELCLYSHFVNTLAEISGDFFLYSAEKIDVGWCQVQRKCSLKYQKLIVIMVLK